MNFSQALAPANVSFILQGFGVTLYVAFVSIIFSFLIGTLFAIIRYAKVPVLSQVIMFIVETIRNLPLLLLLFFTYFALPEIGIKLSIIISAITALTIFESAMLSEIIRSGLTSIDKGQIEASRSSGLTYIQTMRYIILPQALTRMIPPTVSQFISLLKDTSLAIVIALPEVMHNSQIVYNSNPSQYVIPVLIFAALLYFVVNFSLSQLATFIEKKRSFGR